MFIVCVCVREEGCERSEIEDIVDHAKRMNSEGVPESVSKMILANRLKQPATGVKVCSDILSM